MTSLIQILLMLLEVLWFIVIAHVLMSWLINFEVLNIRQPLVARIWQLVDGALKPIYSPIRRAIARLVPNLGGIDISPLVVILVLVSIRIVLRNNLDY